MENTSRRNLWIGLGILALLVLFALPMWGGGMMLGRGMVGPFGPRPFVGPGYAAPWMFGLFGLGLLIRVLFWGMIIFLAVRFFRRAGWRRFDTYDRDHDVADLPPGEILRRRYAAGEINREQYEEMRRTLESTV